jgi:HK97 family phage prohead protease
MTTNRRTIRSEVRAEAGKPVQVVASTDTVLQRGPFFREQLVHDPASVTLAARTLLKNHDLDQIIGRVSSLRIDAGKILADVEFAPTDDGREMEQLVRGGFVDGVSIGYSIEKFTRIDGSDGTLTIRADAWTLREISFTPVPADLGAGVARSESDPDAWAKALGIDLTRTQSDAPMTTTPNAQPPAPVAAPITPAGDEAQRSVELANLRAENAKLKLHSEAVTLGRSHGVELDAIDLEKIGSREAALELILDRKQAASAPAKPAGPVGGERGIVITKDEHDKTADELTEYLGRGMGLSDAVRRIGARSGMAMNAGTREIQDAMVDGLQGLGKRATTISSGLGLITQLAAAKAISGGFDSYSGEADKFARSVFVPDFNTVTVSDLGLSELAAPAGEGQAYADNTPTIVGGSGANEFLGTNFDISLAAIYNDRAGLVMERLKNLGRTAAMTLDKIAMVALEGASFSSATQALAFSEANLGTAYGAHAAVTLKGVAAKRLVVPMALYVAAKSAVTPANGATAGRILAEGDDAIQTVKGWYLTDANDWYLLPDPSEAPAVVLLRHPDYANPKLVYKGEGGGAAMLFRVDFPAKAVVLNTATNKPLCAYKCTQA